MRENPLIILWLENLGIFYPQIGELGLNNIAADLFSTLFSIFELLLLGQAFVFK